MEEFRYHKKKVSNHIYSSRRGTNMEEFRYRYDNDTALHVESN